MTDAPSDADSPVEPARADSRTDHTYSLVLKGRPRVAYRLGSSVDAGSLTTSPPWDEESCVDRARARILIPTATTSSAAGTKTIAAGTHRGEGRRMSERCGIGVGMPYLRCRRAAVPPYELWRRERAALSERAEAA